MLDIKPLHNNGFSCFEDIINSLTSWLNRDFELMFVKAWNFQYTSMDALLNIGDSYTISDNTPKEYELLEKYHGVRINYSVSSTCINDYLDAIKKELSNCCPAAVLIDSFYCPWDPSYKQFHYSHGLIIVGISDDETCIYCTDPYYMKESVLLPIDHLHEGIQAFITLSIVDNITHPEWRSIIENAVNNLITKNNSNTTFDVIRKFGIDLKSSCNLPTCAHTISKFGDGLLLSKLADTGRGRVQFSVALKYLADRYNIEKLHKIYENLLYIGQKWVTVRGILIKGFMTSDVEKFLQRAANKVLEIADEEEKIAYELLEICRNSTPSNNIKNQTSVKSLSSINVMYNDKKIIYLDLTKYFNNKGVGNFTPQIINADLTGTGMYFLDENLPNEEIWKTKDMEFQFPHISNDLNDNISCNSQVIPLPSGSYKSIMLLGCGEWGNFSDKMIISCLNGESSEIIISFTDFTFEPVFDEIIIWKGKGVEKENSIYQIMNTPVHLFAKQYYLENGDNIKSICLPNCPNIHIFAISLL